MDIGFWDAIVGIFEHLAGLVLHLVILFQYVLGAIFAVSIVYLMLIRPLWGAIADRGKRRYWATLFIMIVFAFGLGPFLIISVLKTYGDLAALGMVVVYGAVILLSYKVSGAEKIER